MREDGIKGKSNSVPFGFIAFSKNQKDTPRLPRKSAGIEGNLAAQGTYLFFPLLSQSCTGTLSWHYVYTRCNGRATTFQTSWQSGDMLPTQPHTLPPTGMMLAPVCSTKEENGNEKLFPRYSRKKSRTSNWKAEKQREGYCCHSHTSHVRNPKCSSTDVTIHPQVYGVLQESQMRFHHHTLLPMKQTANSSHHSHSIIQQRSAPKGWRPLCNLSSF